MQISDYVRSKSSQVATLADIKEAQGSLRYAFDRVRCVPKLQDVPETACMHGLAHVADAFRPRHDCLRGTGRNQAQQSTDALPWEGAW